MAVNMVFESAAGKSAGIASDAGRLLRRSATVQLRRAAVLLLPALALLVAAPVLAARPGTAAKATKHRFTIETPIPSFQPPVTDPGQFSFTASGSGAAARSASVERAFRFTPSGQSDNRKALSIGVATRVVALAADRSRASAPAESFVVPSSYGVDVGVAWKGFGVSTGFRHIERSPFTPVLGGPLSDSVNVGVSYGGRNWRTKLEGTAEQNKALSYAPQQRRYSVELGGAYAVAPRLSVTGGVRYRLAPDKPSLLDPNSDDSAVYLGTNIAF